MFPFHYLISYISTFATLVPGEGVTAETLRTAGVAVFGESELEELLS